MIQLRPFQSQLKADIYAAWQSGARNVLAVAPTGAGKTVIFSEVLREHNGPSVAIAHRHELVSQISVALRGRTVSGLHVSWNLQVMLGVDNLSKNNRLRPDMP